ncbi:MAG: 16S rRNA (uracil(1498)-N(3))-methyltransferase [SAR86 cluster bacterium]|uniref:Ribosomal RNA small subunit methyltransferase E n=1 Tax=SAR86 cluster bacterium TaxID=2030880 RepID=A0A2A5B8C2_9GAMM|nr:MAG: 16S rRNA (uracil(1498)-N(3))-methyltransferase [SAR86 cluster bacterium]
MRISRLYFENQLKLGENIHLPTYASHYLSHVLRLRIDDVIHLFNETDGEFLTRITLVKKGEVAVIVEKLIVGPPDAASQPKLAIHLGLGLSRGDRMDFAVQKSTELGASQITPLYTEHGEVRLKADRVEKKLQHWRKIAISASEQSGRLDIPVINAPCTVDVWQQTLTADLSLMLDPSGEGFLTDHSNKMPINQISLLIGPEGGFSEKEIAFARSHDFSVVNLGPRILRTETAPVAALAILQNLYGDMG